MKATHVRGLKNLKKVKKRVSGEPGSPPTLVVAILTKNASFRSYGTFACLLRAHIRNINMQMYT